MFGTVTAVEARRPGSELVADVAAAETVLPVDFVGDFSEEGGTLVVGDVVLDYVGIDLEAETVTLAAPLVDPLEASEPVALLAAGEVTVEWLAHVATDEGDTIEAVIPTALIGYFPEGTYDEPVTVELQFRAGRYEVRSQPIREATFDGAAVWNPYLTRRMGAASIPHNAWTSPSSWAGQVSQAITVTSTTAVVEIAGFYDVKAVASFEANGTGRRFIRLLVNGVESGASADDPDPGYIPYVSCFTTEFLEEGDVVVVEVRQTSGASLALSTGAGRCRFSMFRVST